MNLRDIFLLLVLILSGCAAQSSDTVKQATFFPFADRPTEKVNLQHEIQIVQGTVFHFEQDGSRVIHHFVPAASTLDRNTYVVSVSPVLDVMDFMKVSFDAESDVRGVIASAESYCRQTGYRRVGNGVSIMVGDKSSSLVEFCVPSDIELPPFYKAGDRVPRAQ